MADFLDEMSDVSLLRARQAKATAGPTGLDVRVASARPPVPIDLTSAGFDVIAEAKLASPSEGRLVTGNANADRVVSIVRSYEAGGAAIISVLTEETRFSGSLEHLEAAAAAVDTPVMRKDFLVDPIQVLEARAAGASGVLLISRMLPGSLLAEMTDVATELGMFALVEIFDRSDLESAFRVFDRDVILGVNCRDLSTLEMDTGRFASIAPHLPDHLPTVAESGMSSPGDVSEVAGLGYRLALIGSSLVSATRPGERLGEFLAAGRASLAERA